MQPIAILDAAYCNTRLQYAVSTVSRDNTLSHVIHCDRLYLVDRIRHPPKDGAITHWSPTNSVWSHTGQPRRVCDHTLVNHEQCVITHWSPTNRSIPHIWVLAGSESIWFVVIAYQYFSLPETSREWKYKSEWNTVPIVLIIGLISFLWNTFYYTSAVRGQPKCNFSIFGQMHIEMWVLFRWGWYSKTCVVKIKMEYHIRNPGI